MQNYKKNEFGAKKKKNRLQIQKKSLPLQPLSRSKRR